MTQYTIEELCIGRIVRKGNHTNIDLLHGKLRMDGEPVTKLLAPDSNLGYFPENTFVEIQRVVRDTKYWTPNQGVLFVNCRDLQEDEIELRPSWAEARFERIRGAKIVVAAWADLCYGDITIQEMSKQKQLELSPLSFRVSQEETYSEERIYAKVCPEEELYIEVMILPGDIKDFPREWIGLTGGLLSKRVMDQWHQKRGAKSTLKRW